MSSGALETDMGILLRECINQNPVWFDVTISAADKIAAQWVILIFGWQWFARNQQINDFSEFCQILAALS